jgi:hypothetical protein
MIRTHNSIALVLLGSPPRLSRGNWQCPAPEANLRMTSLRASLMRRPYGEMHPLQNNPTESAGTFLLGDGAAPTILTQRASFASTNHLSAGACVMEQGSIDNWGAVFRLPKLYLAMLKLEPPWRRLWSLQSQMCASSKESRVQ